MRSCAEGNVTRDGAGRGGSGEFLYTRETFVCSTIVHSVF